MSRSAVGQAGGDRCHTTTTVINPGGFWMLPTRRREKATARRCQETRITSCHELRDVSASEENQEAVGQRHLHTTLPSVFVPGNHFPPSSLSLYFLLYLPTHVLHSRVSSDGKQDNPNAGGLEETHSYRESKDPAEARTCECHFSCLLWRDLGVEETSFKNV